MANPELPDRALPAAWRLLMASYSLQPCWFDPDDERAECTEHHDQWRGPGAVELRQQLGVRCLHQVVPRVLEAESDGEVAAYPSQDGTHARLVDRDVTEQAAGVEPPNALRLAEQITLGDLWRAIDAYTAKAETLRFTLGRAIEFDGQHGVSAYRQLVERAVLADRDS